METTKNIDHSNNTHKEMKKITTIDHSNKPYSQETLKVPQTPSPDRHSQQATKTSKSDIKNGNTMIELDGLGSATESFPDEIIMSPNPESNFPRVSISNEVSNYKVQPQNLSLKMCDKLEDNTEYLEKSAAFIGKKFRKFFEETIKCSKQKQICKTKTQEIDVEKSTKIENPHVPLAASPINFINEVPDVSQNDTRKLLEQLSNSCINPFSDCFEAKLKSRVLKVPIPEEFFYLETVNVVSRQGVRRAFGYNYTNFFSDIIKKYNPFWSLTFTRSFIRREDSRKQKAPKFTVEAACQMDGCPAKVTIQQLACGKHNFENIFTLTFQGNIKHKRDDLKARRLIDAKKTEISSKFQNNLNIKPSNLFKEKLRLLDQNQYGFNNRSGAGKSVSTFQSIFSWATKKVFDVHNVFKEILELQKK